MLTAIIQEFARWMESRELEITAQLTQELDFKGLEAALNEECARLNAAMQKAMLQAKLSEETFLAVLKQYAGRRGMRLKEYRRVTLTLSNGQRIEVDSPYFIKAKPPKQRRKKRGPNGSGEHSGLKVLGFIGRASPGLLSDAVQTALLCPSYEAMP